MSPTEGGPGRRAPSLAEAEVREGARLRPTFRVPLDHPRDEAVEALRGALASDPELVGRWQGKGRWAELHVPGVERRIWSPHLSIRLDEEDGRSLLFGRFAPRPEVWTGFMFLYFGVVFFVVLGAILAYVQWVSDEAAWGLWAVWIGIPLLLLLHVASWVGQGLGQDQMRRLRDDLDRALGRAFDS